MPKLDIDILLKNNNLEKFENDKNIMDIINDIKNDLYNFQNYKEDITNSSNVVENFNANPFQKIEEYIKAIEKFFKNVGNFFKKVVKAFQMKTEKIIALAITILIPFIGQLYARIVLLNGSLEMPYLFFISFPPLSLIPALLMVFDIIPKGKNSPWDIYVYVPIVAYITSLFLPLFIINKNIVIISRYIMIIFGFIIALYFKSKQLCNKSLDFKSLTMEACIVYILILILPIIFLYLPIIGSLLKIFAKIMPYGSIIIQVGFMALVYMVFNMITQYLKKEYCKNSNLQYLHLLYLIISSIILSFTVKIPDLY